MKRIKFPRLSLAFTYATACPWLMTPRTEIFVCRACCQGRGCIFLQRYCNIPLLYIICVYIQLRLCMLIIVNQIVGHPKRNRKGLWLLKGLCSHTDLHSIIALFIIQPSQSSMSFKRNIMHGHLCLTNFSQPGPCLSSRHPRNSLCLGSLSIGKMMNLNLLKWNSQRSIKVLQTFWRIVWSGVFRIHMLYSITRRGSWVFLRRNCNWQATCARGVYNVDTNLEAHVYVF